MRLGQLARQLSVRPSQIIEFLAQQNIQIEENSNTRMDDRHVVLVVQKFAPESMEKIVQTPDEIETAEEILPSEVDQPMVDLLPEITPSENTTLQEVEVIRVPKIELSGLKVLGKIELPESKKKDNIQDQVEITTGEEQTDIQKVGHAPRKPREKKLKQRREQNEQRKWSNPLEKQREREAREAEERRLKEIEREKERRKKYYLEKVKTSTQPKRVKPSKEESELKVKPIKKTQPTTWIGKFWKWLRPD